MKIKTLIESIPTQQISGDVETEISGIYYDSRQVRPGGLFVAFSGEHTDGTEYIGDALNRGATAVVSEYPTISEAGVVHIQVKNAREVLGLLASQFYGNLSRELCVIGITGTNGKTTVTYLLRDLLQDAGHKTGLLGTVAYEIGDHKIPATRTTPEAPEIHDFFQKMVHAQCDHAVMEVSSHALDLHRVEGITFSLALFTNLTQDHLDYHHTLEDYFLVKAKLFKGGHPAVINLDDPWGKRLLTLLDANTTTCTYGFNPDADVYATHEMLTEKGSTFSIHTPWGKGKIRSQLLGRFNIYNVLAALAAGGVLGLNLDTMIRTLSKIPAVSGRLERVQNRKKLHVFIDYAHTDDALKNVLKTLREICKGRLVVVFGCGGDRDRKKRRLMGRVAAELADHIVVTSDNPRKEEPEEIIAEILEGMPSLENVDVVVDRREAIRAGLSKLKRKDILLVAGKGHETYQELRDTIIPFNDRDVVREILG